MCLQTIEQIGLIWFFSFINCSFENETLKPEVLLPIHKTTAIVPDPFKIFQPCHPWKLSFYPENEINYIKSKLGTLKKELSPLKKIHQNITDLSHDCKAIFVDQ